MSLLDVALCITCFWGILHLVKSVFHRYTITSTSSLLGWQHILTKPSLPGVQLDLFYLRLETTRLNDYHDILSHRLASSPSLKNITRAFYNIGSLCCIVGMLLAEALLLWSIYFTTKAFLGLSGAHMAHSQTLPSVYKRDWQDIQLTARDDIPSDVSNGPPVSLLVSFSHELE